MSNVYKIFCMDCEEYFDLDNENCWWQNEEQMYCLKDFLLSHTDHMLKVGGDEWNRAFDYYDDNGEMGDGKQLPTKDYKEHIDTYSKQDYKEIKRR